jgi:2-methylcitrate dehydratase PrpD
LELKLNESSILAKYVAGIRYEDLPSRVVKTTKMSLLDALGITLAASGQSVECQPFVELAIDSGGKKESTIIGFHDQVPAPMAAFANGSMAHALDFEDTHDEALVHPNAASIPAALAIAEALGIGGKEFIVALAVGSDITSRLGLALKKDPIEFGWYMPPIFNAFGAAAATGNLLKLNPQQVLDAFSLALCQATCSAELVHSPHTVIRGVRDAFSAKAGLISALLAEKGVPGFEHPMEGPAGLFRLYAREEYDLSRMIKELGETFEGANISFKLWPCCRGTHSFLEAALRCLGDNDLDPMDIDSLKIITSPSPLQRALCKPLERKRNPQTAIDAKFSIPFVVATTLIYGEVKLKHFSRDALEDKKVLTMAERVTLEVDEKLPEGRGAIVIRSKGRNIREETPEFAYGHPRNPMSTDDTINKFLDCVGYSRKKIPYESQQRLIEAVLNLEDQDNIRAITDCL